MTGYTAYANALISNCYCSTECGDSCTDFCATGDGSVAPSTECETCVQGVANDQNSECIQGFSAACQADPECLGFANETSVCQ